MVLFILLYQLVNSHFADVDLLLHKSLLDVAYREATIQKNKNPFSGFDGCLSHTIELGQITHNSKFLPFLTSIWLLHIQVMADSYHLLYMNVQSAFTYMFPARVCVHSLTASALWM